MIADVAAIVAHGMGIRRGRRWLLRPAAFGMAGGVIGLAGPPGAGKSTLLATFATLRRPNAGALEILGFDAGKAGELRALRARLGYLPDRCTWAANLTVREFVGYAAYYKRVPAKSWRAMLELMDLGDAADQVLGLLPPDVRLRAALAATCAHGPDLVLLDDPLSALHEDHPDLPGLDPEPLQALIRTMAPTVLVTARRAEDLIFWCDRVFVLTRGRLKELPTLADGTNRPAPGLQAIQTLPARPARPVFPVLRHAFGGHVIGAVSEGLRRAVTGGRHAADDHPPSPSGACPALGVASAPAQGRHAMSGGRWTAVPVAEPVAPVALGSGACV